MGGGISHPRRLITAEKPVINAISDTAPEVVASPSVHDITTIPSETPLKKALLPEMNLDLLISPRRELALRSSVPFTPLGKDASIYCYYCPLCMEFFESIMRTKCCGNYICLKCTIEYLNAKGFVAETVREIIGNSHLKSVNCPNCFSTGFNPQLVEKNDSIRDYSREVTDLPENPEKHSPGNTYTPLKVGDTFEDLKRKMIPFAIMKSINSMEENIVAIIARDNDIETEPDSERPKSLCSYFDSVAERMDARSPAEPDSLQQYNIDDIAPDCLVLDCIRNLEENAGVINDSNSARMQLTESVGGITQAIIRRSSESTGVNISVEILAKNTHDAREVLNNFLTEDSTLKNCCRIIASEMMKKIIDSVVLESKI